MARSHVFFLYLHRVLSHKKCLTLLLLILKGSNDKVKFLCVLGHFITLETTVERGVV